MSKDKDKDKDKGDMPGQGQGNDNDPTGLMITIQHARKAGYCTKGMRVWFEARGLDFKEFRTVGLNETVLADTGDMQALRLIEIAHGR